MAVFRSRFRGYNVRLPEKPEGGKVRELRFLNYRYVTEDPDEIEALENAQYVHRCPDPPPKGAKPEPAGAVTTEETPAPRKRGRRKGAKK